MIVDLRFAIATKVHQEQSSLKIWLAHMNGADPILLLVSTKKPSSAQFLEVYIKNSYVSQYYDSLFKILFDNYRKGIQDPYGRTIFNRLQKIKDNRQGISGQFYFLSAVTITILLAAWIGYYYRGNCLRLLLYFIHHSMFRIPA